MYGGFALLDHSLLSICNERLSYTMGAFHLEKNPEISVGAKVDFPTRSDFLNKLLSVTLNRSKTDQNTSELAMNKTNAGTWLWTGIAGLLKWFPCGMLPAAATSLHSFPSVPLVIRRG